MKSREQGTPTGGKAIQADGSGMSGGLVPSPPHTGKAWTSETGDEAAMGAYTQKICTHSKARSFPKRKTARAKQ